MFSCGQGIISWAILYSLYAATRAASSRHLVAATEFRHKIVFNKIALIAGRRRVSTHTLAPIERSILTHQTSGPFRPGRSRLSAVSRAFTARRAFLLFFRHGKATAFPISTCSGKRRCVTTRFTDGCIWRRHDSERRTCALSSRTVEIPPHEYGLDIKRI